VLKTLCKVSLEPDSCVSQTQTRFERWGINSLVIAKFVPGLSIIAPPMAGAMRIGWPRFHFSERLRRRSLGWGRSRRRCVVQIANRAVAEHVSAIGSAAGAGVLILLAAYIAFKWWERRRFYRMLRMARISVADLYELIQVGAAPVIIDVRSVTARELEPRWIPGALHVPLQDVARQLKELPRDRDIILYCTCPSEASAARVAKVLMNHGFNAYARCRADSMLGRRRLCCGHGRGDEFLRSAHDAPRGHCRCRIRRLGGSSRSGRRRRPDHHHRSAQSPFVPAAAVSSRTATLATSEIAWPVRHLLRKRKEVTTLLGAVTGVDTENRKVLLEDGGIVAYDTLILATGARHAYFGHDEWEPFAPGLKTLEDATTIRRRVLLSFERAEREADPARRAALLTFVIVGGVPPEWNCPAQSPNLRIRICPGNTGTSTRARLAWC